MHIFICSSRTCENNCHILIGCLFVNLRLTHEPCLGITIVSLYCFGSLAAVTSGLLTIVKTGITIVSYFGNVTASLFALTIVRKFTPR